MRAKAIAFWAARANVGVTAAPASAVRADRRVIIVTDCNVRCHRAGDPVLAIEISQR
jgi:hypothetical protein